MRALKFAEMHQTEFVTERRSQRCAGASETIFRPASPFAVTP